MVPTWRRCEALGRRGALQAQAGSESQRVGVKSTPRRLPTWWAWRVPQDMADNATYLYYVFVTGPKIRGNVLQQSMPLVSRGFSLAYGYQSFVPLYLTVKYYLQYTMREIWIHIDHKTR